MVDNVQKNGMLIKIKSSLTVENALIEEIQGSIP